MAGVLRSVLIGLSSRTCLLRSLQQFKPATFARTMKIFPQVHCLKFQDFSNPTESEKIHGLVLGVYTKDDGLDIEYTNCTNLFNKLINGKLTNELQLCKKFSKEIKQRLFYNLSEEYPLVSVIHLGKRLEKYGPLEYINEENETIRNAIGCGVKALADAGADVVFVDQCQHPECASEAANLVLFCYDELKAKSSRKMKLPVYPFVGISKANKVQFETDDPEWNRGTIKAIAQRFAMTLMEAPANLMNPENFVARVAEQVQNLPVELIIRDRVWAENKKMGSFLSVAKGSLREPLLLEMHYRGGEVNDRPIVLVGKGITFDSGGISLKPSLAMDKMRADMGGAAVVASSIYAVAALKLKINVTGIIPLCENMPGGGATKPGDVVFAMNGKSIQVDNTDAEGRLILADGLVYAQDFKPAFIVDLATLTGAILVALGSAACGAFTNTPEILELLKKASYETGDRVWEMPLFKHYANCIKNGQLADLNNVGNNRNGGACTAAAFLKEFVGDCKWIHLDIASVMEHEGEIPYLPKGMSGRPTRTIVEFLKIISEKKYCKNS